MRPAPTAVGQEAAVAAITARRELMLLVCVVALLAAACLPFFRVYASTDFVNPVAAAILVPVGIAWACRRVGLGTLVTATVGVATLAVFTGVVFLPDTMRFGVVPTLRTLSEGIDVAQQGIAFAQTRPSPVLPEPGLLLLTVLGVWTMALMVETMTFSARSPLKAIVVALTLWAVPLSMAPDTTRLWPWAVPVLAASALLLLLFAGADVGRWGAWVTSGNSRTAGWMNPLTPIGWFTAAGAIVAGTTFAASLPGAGDAPWYELRGRSGTTLTANPIVQMRANLTAQDTGPLFRVTTTRPVYLRSTALDVYDDQEQWTSSGIVGRQVRRGSLPGEIGPDSQPFTVRVEVAGLDGAVLVPAPYDPVAVSGGIAGHLQFDPSNATFTLDRGETLKPGDAYTMLAGGRAAAPEDLTGSAPADAADHLTALPDNVPEEVAELAHEIVAEAGADSPFAAALAIQQELRSWTYSLNPPQGHSSAAMRAFLETRTGYCEQFAGTMAVMLRTLGIPARVATGFTPGQVQNEGEPMTAEALTDEVPDQYTVTWSNAHAWVEALFPGDEWVAFEPTPRSDGNVLVPTPGTVTPETTVAQLAGTDAAMSDESETVQDPFAEVPEDFLRGQADALDEATGTRGIAGGDGAARRWTRVLAGAVAGVVALLLLVVARARAVTRRATSPTQRVLLARARIGYLGRAVGMRAHPWETDREYLSRLAVGTDSRRAAADLAAITAQVRYAPTVPVDAVERAERAEQALARGLIGNSAGMRHAMLQTRGRLVMGWDALTDSVSALGRRMRQPTRLARRLR